MANASEGGLATNTPPPYLGCGLVARPLLRPLTNIRLLRARLSQGRPGLPWSSLGGPLELPYAPSTNIRLSRARRPLEAQGGLARPVARPPWWPKGPPREVRSGSEIPWRSIGGSGDLVCAWIGCSRSNTNTSHATCASANNHSGYLNKFDQV